MNDIMLDLETMATSSNAAIMSIGAVFFDDYTTGEEFYQVVDLESAMMSGGEVGASTILWWMQQDDEARNALLRPGAPLNTVLEAFSRWVKQNSYATDCRIWGNGVAFDNVILANAYNRCGLVRPWKYKHDRCYRTFMSFFDLDEIHTPKVAHCAVEDARSQAINLINAMKLLRRPDDK